MAPTNPTANPARLPATSGFGSVQVLSGSWTRPCPKTCGIVNTAGATCYLSSLLQALAHVPIISNLPVKAWKDACGCPPDSHCWSCYVGVWINSRALVKKASETPIWALRRMHEIYATARDMGKWTPSKGLDKVPMGRRSFDHADPSELFTGIQTATVEAGPTQKAFLTHLLGSVTRVSRECRHCSSQILFGEDHMCRLTLLDSSTDEVCSNMGRCLDQFLAEDTQEEASLCDVCSRKTVKVCTSSFYCAPNVLVFTMPVTDRTNTKMRAEHIQVYDQLNLTKWMHSEAPELKSNACLDYDLVAVSVHCGATFKGGHYYPYCRRQAADGSPGSWMKFDDENVFPDIPWEEVAASRGFLYLYNRRQPRQQPIPTPPNYTDVFTERPPPLQSLPLLALRTPSLRTSPHCPAQAAVLLAWALSIPLLLPPNCSSLLSPQAVMTTAILSPRNLRLRRSLTIGLRERRELTAMSSSSFG